jgi:hypothetical protein
MMMRRETTQNSHTEAWCTRTSWTHRRAAPAMLLSAFAQHTTRTRNRVVGGAQGCIVEGAPALTGLGAEGTPLADAQSCLQG